MKWPSHVTLAQDASVNRSYLCLKNFKQVFQCLTLFFFFNLFLAALGLHCCSWAFSSCGGWGLLFIAVSGLLIAVASFVVEHRLQAHGLSTCGSRALVHRLSTCGTWAQLFRSMWDLPGPGLEPVTPALAGKLPTTAPPGKSLVPYS